MSAAAPDTARDAAPVLAIVGPTASGKTALSLPLAEALSAEIISMDSRQVYRGMDIGTAKVTPAERSRVPHHGLDLVDPGARYSAGRFARDARRWIPEIRSRGRLPMLVGGTGFFLKALLEPVFREPPMDPDRRLELQSALDTFPREELDRWVERLDPERAALARAGGPQRLVRTLEVALLTGRPLSWWHAHAPPEAAPVPARIVRLVLPRAENVARIDARAQAMFDEGLLAEVDGLLQAGVTRGDPGMTGTGYREAADVLLGEASLEEAVARVQQATRAYARRQVTWFRHQLPPGVLELDALLPLADQVDTVLQWWGTGSPRTRADASQSVPANEVPT
ncbi:tRNA (adenosine(37)-N6)-dimethylallyltransferase MiaA [soil metagenome]